MRKHRHAQPPVGSRVQVSMYRPFLYALRRTSRTWSINARGLLRNRCHQCPLEAVTGTRAGNVLVALYRAMDRGLFCDKIVACADKHTPRSHSWLRAALLKACGVREP